MLTLNYAFHRICECNRNFLKRVYLDNPNPSLKCNYS